MRTDRHTVEYRCDQCPEATGRAVLYENMPCPPGGWVVVPRGWFVISRYAQGEPVHLCSVRCLQLWASKVEASG